MKKINRLSSEEEQIIINKGTEPPFSGKYCNFFKPGIYLCKRCDSPLYSSYNKFSADCGWPSFDAEMANSVAYKADKDSVRTEILCANCGAHLGHVFSGEGYTPKNVRHCVNSLSLSFEPKVQENNLTESSENSAIFAGGCFWGIEHYFMNVQGVVSTKVGYIGGHTSNPTYLEVCSGKTGHAEAVRIVFDSTLISYEKLVRLFFEIHDPTQINRQGPDVGTQYRSEIFYLQAGQKAVAEKIIDELQLKGVNVATNISSAGVFWEAEDYHQQYLAKQS